MSQIMMFDSESAYGTCLHLLRVNPLLSTIITKPMTTFQHNLNMIIKTNHTFLILVLAVNRSIQIINKVSKLYQLLVTEFLVQIFDSFVDK